MDIYEKPKSLIFNVSQFEYKIEYLNDNVTKDKSMLIEAEHLDTKRVWKILIDKNGLIASSQGGKNKIMLGPETIFKAFKLAIESQTSESNDFCDLNNKINAGSFSIEFPVTGKDEKSSLVIVIDIENQFAELYQQCPITLEPIEMTNEELHEKQIEHLRQTVSKLESKIKKLQNDSQKVRNTNKKYTTNSVVDDQNDFVTREEFEELKNKIKTALAKKMSKQECENFTIEKTLGFVTTETFYSTLQKKVSIDSMKKTVSSKVSKNELKAELQKMVSVEDFNSEIYNLKSMIE